jgi:hypothetical protein
MRKSALIALLAVGLLVVPAAHGDAWRGHGHGHVHGRVFIGVGPSFWWGPSPWWYYPPPTYVYAPPPVVVQEQPPVYVQQPQTPEAYWYYCASSKAYYPDVPSCSEAWIKVPPRAQ